MKGKKIFLMFVVSMFVLTLVSAEVGLGISPSKMKEHLITGSSYEYDIIVFNVGDESMEITLVANGEIAPFTTITPVSQMVEPEPLPHEFPIKNGKVFHVVFDIPNGGKERIYDGSFSAVGKGDSGSQFGGNVAVVSRVELNVLPPTSFLEKLTPIHYLAFGAVVLLALIVIGLKKAGLKIQFGANSAPAPVKKKRKPSKKK